MHVGDGAWQAAKGAALVSGTMRTPGMWQLGHGRLQRLLYVTAVRCATPGSCCHAGLAYGSAWMMMPALAMIAGKGDGTDEEDSRQCDDDSGNQAR